MKHSRVFCLAASLFVMSCAVANAHAFLKTASPKPNSVVALSPRAVHMTFTEGLVAPFSSATLVGPGGVKPDVGKTQISGTRMTLPIAKPLPPGRYRVIWRATALDTHKTHGSFAFRIKK